MSRGYRTWRWAAVCVYLVVIALFTLTPRRGTSGAVTPNFAPLDSLIALFRWQTRRGVVTNITGNLLLFAPLAVLLRVLITRSATRVLIVVMAASVAVEAVQGLGWTDGRHANVDDVLLNVAGAAIALGIRRLLRDPPFGSN
ncbi:MAG: VanZ family protein [Frankiaceae bacterium]|nr:VanZ family protein [Frankiaceae bacterium]